MSQQAFFHVLVATLERLGIPFMVTGSYASSHYGMPRTTNDLDIVIDPTAEQLDALCMALATEYYVSGSAARAALRDRFMFNVIDVADGCKADLLIRKDRPFSIAEFARRRVSSLHGQSVFLASPEDVILSKLEWNKLTASERQVQDALNVALVQWPQLDEGYLRHWATELAVTDTLEEVLRTAQAPQNP